MPYNVPAGTRTIYGGRYGAPAWRRDLGAFAWASIPTTLDDVDPNDDVTVNPNFPSAAPWQVGPQSRVTISWGGGAYDEVSKFFYVWGGGHNDYAGNELYRVDMSTDAPTWERIRDPANSLTYPGPTLDDGDEGLGYYSGYGTTDYQPRSYHTYGGLVVHGGLLYALCPSAPYKGGQNTPNCWRYDPYLDRWQIVDTKPTTANNATFSSGVYDPVRDQWAYIPGGPNVVDVFDFGTQLWTAGAGGSTGFTSTYARAAYHPGFDAIICFSDSVPGHVAYYELPLSSGVGATFATTTGTPPPTATTYGVVYVPSLNNFIAWVGGATIYILTPPATIGGTWAWSTSALDATNYLPPASESAGTWGRMAWDNELNCLVLINRTVDPVIIGTGG